MRALDDFRTLLKGITEARGGLDHRELELLDFLGDWPQSVRDSAGKMYDANRDFLDAMEGIARLMVELLEEDTDPADNSDAPAGDGGAATRGTPPDAA